MVGLPPESERFDQREQFSDHIQTGTPAHDLVQHDQRRDNEK